MSRTEAETTLLKDVLQRYASEVLPMKRSEQSDKSHIKTLLDAFGSYRMVSLTSTQVAKFRDERLQIVGLQSVTHEINLQNRGLQTAMMDWEIALPRGVAYSSSKQPAKPRGRDRRVSEEKIAKIVATTESAELKTIIVVAVETGMRRNELASLTWEEINLKKQRAHLPKTKTDAPRTVPLSKAAVLALKAFGPQDQGRVFSLQAESMSQAF